jgi:hypothetical protein
MAKRFAVSYINWDDNELVTEIHEAPDWATACMKLPKIAQMFPDEEGGIPLTVEEAKQAAFDQDAMINVIEIPERVKHE